MDLKLNERTCLVTGASAGIGMGIAKVLAQQKVRLAITGRRADRLEKLADEIADQCGSRPLVITEDLATQDGPIRVAKRALDAFGKVDIVVNNAGASRPLSPDAGADADAVWDESFALNFTAARRLTEALLPKMRANQWGRVINVTGFMEPRHLNAAYSAKAALHLWAKGLSCTVAKEGIAINCIAPGIMKSEQILERLLPDEKVRQKFVDDNVPIGYLGEPEDIGHLVAFLASPLASYITGAVIPVDGGMHYFAM